LTGRTAELALAACGITVNKNMIPFDKRKPMDPSGIRIGTPALTTRGMDQQAMKTIGGWITEVLKTPDDEKLRRKIRGQVSELCRQYPVPPIPGAANTRCRPTGSSPIRPRLT
ncbi:unnamed protein product, partial [marine sediment metagenome]